MKGNAIEAAFQPGDGWTGKLPFPQSPLSDPWDVFVKLPTDLCQILVQISLFMLSPCYFKEGDCCWNWMQFSCFFFLQKISKSVECQSVLALPPSHITFPLCKQTNPELHHARVITANLPLLKPCRLVLVTLMPRDKIPPGYSDQWSIQTSWNMTSGKQ